jgi:hypothetical protein
MPVSTGGGISLLCNLRDAEFFNCKEDFSLFDFIEKAGSPPPSSSFES